MNAPTYQRKDYSYLPQAFGQASQAFGQIGQGLQTAMSIGDRERKRAQEDEYIANIKVTNEQAEQIRDQAIIEAVPKLRIAMGLPDDEKGDEMAFNKAVSIFYPLTAEELKKGTAVTRLNKIEQDILPGILNKASMKTFEKEYLAGKTTQQMPPRAEYKEPQGRVGVEDRGDVKQPLSAFAQSKGELQQSAERELGTQPRLFDTVSQEMDSERAFDRAVELGIIDSKQAKELIGLLGRRELAATERPEGTFQEPVMREALTKPIVTEEAKEYAQTYPKALTPKDLLDAKAKAEKIARGSEKDTDEKIIDLMKIEDRQRGLLLNANKNLSTLRKAKVMMEAKQTLSPSIMAALEGKVSNPSNPDMAEVDDAIARTQSEVSNIQKAIKSTKGYISTVSKGEPISRAVTKEEETKKSIIDEGFKYIITDIAPNRTIQTTRQIVKALPEKYKIPIQEAIDGMKSEGVSEFKIVKGLLGR